MASRRMLSSSGVSNDMERNDSGWSSNDNLTDVTSIDNISSTTIYPASTISSRDNSSTTMGRSTTMSSLTTVYEMNSRSNNISMMSIHDTRPSNVASSYSYTGPYVLTKDYDDQNASLYPPMDEIQGTLPEDMFPPYQSIFPADAEINPKKESIVKEKEKNHPSSTSLTNTTLSTIDYSMCCLSSTDGITDCGPSANARVDWPVRCVLFEALDQISVQGYLIRKGIISMKEADRLRLSEKDLIANRLAQKNILIDNNTVICPKHRNSFGVGWCDQSSVCHHPEHDPCRRSKPLDCRTTSLINCWKIQGFPIGGKLCSKHRKLVSEMTEVDTFSQGSYTTHATPFEIDNTRDSMNRILDEADVSPIRSQTTKALKQQSKSAVRRLLSKLQRGTQILQEKFAETLAPGEGSELLRIAKLNEHSHEENDDAEMESNEMVDNIRKIYDQYVAQNMPFAEQTRLLSLLPRSWMYHKIMVKFNCSRHAVKVAHKIRDDVDYYLKKDEGPVTRQRVDPERIRHFITWLVDSQLLVSGTYGVTTITLDNGEKYVIPKQILQSQRTHAIIEYLKYCEETNFDNVCKTKLFEILDGIKSTSQRVVSGLDEFVIEGVEAWDTIANIVANLPIPQIDRKRLKQQIQMGETYQKIHHLGHCSNDADCITHCTTFALSDPKCIDQYMHCCRPHVVNCRDCLNVLVTLDEIEEKIKKLPNDELRLEAGYDFENCRQHIHEWFRHNIRAARQNKEKVNIISNMTANEAFATFDWGQKVLPQEHREGQSTYFGKSGMSLLVGSFAWNDTNITSTTRTTSSSATTASSSSTLSLRTQSYILALTSAAQTELDTLSASEIVLTQFRNDYPNIDTIYKRTDNASNFSSNSTPEIEKVICDRVGIHLKVRDYSEVQKGKDICDRICGVAKSRMRSWISSGNDLCNAIDIKEGMEYAGGVRNTKIGVAEIMSNTGKIGKTTIPNISSVRSISYYSDHMRIFKASGIGPGVSLPYRHLTFESNMRLVSPFTVSIDQQQVSSVPKSRTDRQHHDLSICPVAGCQSTFTSIEELDAHIATDTHVIIDDKHRSSTDIARLHLIEAVRSTTISTRDQTSKVFQDQQNESDNLNESSNYKYYSDSGWGLRQRKHTHRMPTIVKSFIEKLYLESLLNQTKMTPEAIHHECRTSRTEAGTKLFGPPEYPSINQIKYQCRKLAKKYEIYTKQQLVEELIKEQLDKKQ